MTHMLSEFAFGTFLNAPRISLVQTLRRFMPLSECPAQQGFSANSGVVAFCGLQRRYRKEFLPPGVLISCHRRIELNRVVRFQALAKHHGSS